MISFFDFDDEETIVNLLILFLSFSIMALYLIVTPDGEEMIYFLRTCIW
jgi:hypothetical protein